MKNGFDRRCELFDEILVDDTRNIVDNPLKESSVLIEIELDILH